MEYREISINEISECDFQKRRNIEKDLDSLVEDVKHNGVIEPIIVRPMKLGEKKWELICGARRLKAAEKAKLEVIPARIAEVDDIQARLMHLSENLERKNLTPIEQTEAIGDFLDAFLKSDPELGDEYKRFGGDYIERLKKVLSILDNTRRSKERGSKVNAEVEELSHRFVGQVEKVFSQLLHPTDWRSFFVHDLPLITETDPEIQEIGVEANLSKSQIKELDKVKKETPQIYERIKEKIKGSPRELSAEQLRALREKESARKEASEHPHAQLDPEELDYEPEKRRQRRPTFESVDEVRKKLEEIEGEINAAISLFRKEEDDLEAFLNSLGKLIQTATRLKKSIEEEAYKSLTELTSNGNKEKVEAYPWAKRILDSREKRPDSRVWHLKNAYERLYFQNFEEKSTEADGKVARLVKVLLAKVEEKEITQVLEFYLSVRPEQISKFDRKIYEKPRTFSKFYNCFAQIREHMRTLQSEPPEIGELTRWYLDEIWKGNPPEDPAIIKECWKDLLSKVENESKDPVAFLKETYQWWKKADETGIDPKHRWVIQGDTTRGIKAFRGKFYYILSAKEGPSKWNFQDADYTIPEDWK